MELKECNRKNSCFDCDNTKCYHAGKKEADCPKYRCNRDGYGFLNCDNCAFVDRIIKSERQIYKVEIAGNPDKLDGGAEK